MPPKFDPSKPIQNPRKFREMVPEFYPVRVQMEHLHMALGSIKQAHEDPSRLRLGDVFRLADMLNEDVEVILAELVQEIKAFPYEMQPINLPKRVRRTSAKKAEDESQEE